MSRKKFGGVKPPPQTEQERIHARIFESCNRILREIQLATGIAPEPFDDVPDDDRQADISQVIP